MHRTPAGPPQRARGRPARVLELMRQRPAKPCATRASLSLPFAPPPPLSQEYVESHLKLSELGSKFAEGTGVTLD